MIESQQNMKRLWPGLTRRLRMCRLATILFFKRYSNLSFRRKNIWLVKYVDCIQSHLPNALRNGHNSRSLDGLDALRVPLGLDCHKRGQQALFGQTGWKGFWWGFSISFLKYMLTSDRPHFGQWECHGCSNGWQGFIQLCPGSLHGSYIRQPVFC